jgi:hypothetical protein
MATISIPTNDNHSNTTATPTRTLNMNHGLVSPPPASLRRANPYPCPPAGELSVVGEWEPAAASHRRCLSIHETTQVESKGPSCPQGEKVGARGPFCLGNVSFSVNIWLSIWLSNSICINPSSKVNVKLLFNVNKIPRGIHLFNSGASSPSLNSFCEKEKSELIENQLW